MVHKLCGNYGVVQGCHDPTSTAMFHFGENVRNCSMNLFRVFTLTNWHTVPFKQAVFAMKDCFVSMKRSHGELTKYPKAGDALPTVQLGVVDFDNPEKVNWLDMEWVQPMWFLSRMILTPFG